MEQTTPDTNEYSIYIPYVLKKITKTQIHNVFKSLNLGHINDIVITPENEKGWSVVIHFQFWNTNTKAKELRNKLDAGEEVKIIYDEPHFWMISKLSYAIKRPKRANAISTPPIENFPFVNFESLLEMENK